MKVGNVKIVSLLINSKKSLASQYSTAFDSLLTAACRFGHKDIAVLFLQNGTGVRALSLHEASKQNDRAMLEMLLKNGGHAVVNESTPRSRQDQGF